MRLYGSDPQVSSLAYLSFVLQQLGYPDQARGAILRAKELADGLGQFNTTALVLMFLCFHAVLRRDMGALSAPAHELLTLARRYGTGYWELHGQTFVARLHAAQGQLERALEQIRECIFGWQARFGFHAAMAATDGGRGSVRAGSV